MFSLQCFHIHFFFAVPVKQNESYPNPNSRCGRRNAYRWIFNSFARPSERMKWVVSQPSKFGGFFIFYDWVIGSSFFFNIDNIDGKPYFFLRSKTFEASPNDAKWIIKRLGGAFGDPLFSHQGPIGNLRNLSKASQRFYMFLQ